MQAVFAPQNPQVIKRNFETTLAFFKIQKAKGVSLNLDLELGTKLCFAEFLISQREFVRAEDLIAEVRVIANTHNSQVSLEKCGTLIKHIQEKLAISA